MTELESIAGRVLMIGLPGAEIDAGLAERIRHISPGGVILFARNLNMPEQTRRLLDLTEQAAGHPLLRGLDQEGGRVSRLEPWVGRTPTAEELAAAGEGAARRFGAATARALSWLGFNLDFAPVVDLCHPTSPNGIGNRSFGMDAANVVRLAGGFLDGLQERGVAGCLKHFPGLGPTSVDSHEQLPTAERDGGELRALDLVPYRALASRAATIMVGHGHYPALDARPGLPATLSETIVTSILREELGYGGLIVSDDLEMGAVAPLDSDGAAAVRAIEAGCDLLLYCAKLDLAERARAALLGAAGERPAFRARLESAAAAVARATERWSLADRSDEPWAQARVELTAFGELA